MEIKLTLLALVFEANTSFFAAVAVERDLGVFEFELVVWVDWMIDSFVNLHGSDLSNVGIFFFQLFGTQEMCLYGGLCLYRGFKFVI